MLGRARLILWALVALAAIGVVALTIASERQDSPVLATNVVPDQKVAALGGPFTLTAADGTRFDSKQLAGKPYAIFFGFTHCPDVCPTALARMARLRKALGKGDAGFEILFVSVDPERDTPQVLAPYVGLFNTPITALTGTPAEIETVKKSHGIFAAKREEGAGYMVDHSTAVLLFDRAGQFVATIAPQEDDAAALGKLERITA